MNHIVKRKVNYGLYIAAVLISALFFISGVVIGDYFAYQKVNSLDISQNAMSALLKLSELKGEILQKELASYCNLSWSDVWQEKVSAGDLLGSLEVKLGKSDPRIVEQKYIYNELQARTLKLVEDINDNCGLNWTIILFFYTNDKDSTLGSSEQCAVQGSVLDTVHDNYEDNVKIFSFDMGALDSLSSGLVEEYNITHVPTLVINKEVYTEFMSRNEIIQIIAK